MPALALVAAWAVLAIAGCGDDDDPTPPPAATTTEPRDREQRRPQVGDGRGGVELREIGTFEQPVLVTQPPSGDDRPDDSLYVVEQTGRVLRLGRDDDPEEFLDLSGEVSCCGEQGLLSIAFAPDYGRTGLLYASFTDAEGNSRVVEYRAQGGDVEPGSARELLAVDQPASNHNGGLLAFDPQGELLLGLGDGGSAGDPDRNGQDPTTLLGKLVRVDTSGEGDHEIVATGLRNPWRFSFDRETGDLWIGDVGQQEVEEINAVRPDEIDGANFGWSAFEGHNRFNADEEAPGHVPPVFTYGHDEGCSVTGGHVVRDRELESLYGRYLYGDYCRGELRSFTAEPGSAAGDDAELGVQIPGLSSFGEDARGRVYAVSIQGPVYRLEPSDARPGG